ncbi:MAG: DUF4139 domain-containing protein [Flavobacteriales bacterium]|nr:DUF4139 domain-containing protein [Flavobacteriales bacterium]
MRTTILLLSVFATTISFAQTGKLITVDPGIERMTVYLNGGEVRTSTEVDLAAGLNTIELKELSQFMYVQSVQVAIKGELAILSVNPAEDRIPADRSEPRIARLQDSLEMLNTRVIELNDRIGANQAAKQMLTSNYDIGGSNAVTTAEALAKTADFFHDRTLKLNRDISADSREKLKLEEVQRNAAAELAKLESAGGRERKKVTVVVNTDRAMRTKVELRYLVANTGWSPAYDLVAANNTGPITLRYKAQVYNNTGIDWKKMNLVLSTADPSLGASSPALARWELGGGGGSGSGVDGRFDQGDYKQSQNMAPSLNGWNDASQHYEMITVSEVTAEFKIKRTYDIPSDARPYMVEVAEHTLPATYSYVAIPKVDCDAFLMARITGWETLDLVDGPANVYYEDSYVGESMISTAGINDTLDLSLGRDNDIRVERKELEDRTSRKVIGSERKQTLTYEITVKNTTTAPIHLVLRDQIPVSMNDQIKVQVLELSGGELDAPEGLVEWPMDLQPAASSTVKLSFEIRHPKGWNVSYRTRLRKQKLLF